MILDGNFVQFDNPTMSEQCKRCLPSIVGETLWKVGLGLEGLKQRLAELYSCCGSSALGRGIHLSSFRRVCHDFARLSPYIGDSCSVFVVTPTFRTSNLSTSAENDVTFMFTGATFMFGLRIISGRVARGFITHCVISIEEILCGHCIAQRVTGCATAESTRFSTSSQMKRYVVEHFRVCTRNGMPQQ